MNPLADRDDCTLLIIDTQARMMPAIDGGDEVIRRCVQLAKTARDLKVHVIGTEQSPESLGPMVGELTDLCDTVLAKSQFSAAAEPGFLHRLPAGRHTIVVAGCEAHVCVLQTVIGLIDAGYAVKWVADATGSRHAPDRQAAIDRARQLGADIVTTEMVIFEWLRSSEHPAFRRALQTVR